MSGDAKYVERCELIGGSLDGVFFEVDSARDELRFTSGQTGAVSVYRRVPGEARFRLVLDQGPDGSPRLGQ